MGKAIYNPSGKAGEYSPWACNFYVGCSNGCEYCYCKKGILAGVMGQDKPQLKKCFRDEKHALVVFEKELLSNLEQLRRHGLFFSFTTDPLLENTIKLTTGAVYICLLYDVPVKILTKRADWISGYRSGDTVIYFPKEIPKKKRNMVAFGFTLTGHDELEQGASTNAERIKAMRKLHDAGFKTFASIEPIVDVSDSIWMIAKCYYFCDLFKVGLMSGKGYDRNELTAMVQHLTSRFDNNLFYFKDSLLKAVGISRSDLPNNCVGQDYNIFKNQ